MDYDFALIKSSQEGLSFPVSNNFEVSDRDGYIYIRHQFPQAPEDLNDLIILFVSNIEKYCANIFTSDSILEIGAYYSVNERVAFGVKLRCDVMLCSCCAIRRQV